MSAPYRVGAAAAAPVSLEEACAHVRANLGDDDMVIATLLDAATELVSEACGLVLGAESWAIRFVASGSVDVPLQKAPVTSLTAISWIAADGTSVTGDVANFIIVQGQDKPMIRPVTGQSWPVTALRADAITATFAAGLTTVPRGLAVAILMVLGTLYDHRESVSEVNLTEVPMAAKALIDIHRRGWVAA